MTLVLMIAATAILLILIFWRGRSREFRRRSEYPKFRFLSNLGISGRGSPAEQPSPDATPNQHPTLTRKEPHEEHEP